jgi:hypothetical protein
MSASRHRTLARSLAVWAAEILDRESARFHFRRGTAPASAGIGAVWLQHAHVNAIAATAAERTSPLYRGMIACFRGRPMSQGRPATSVHHDHAGGGGVWLAALIALGGCSSGVQPFAGSGSMSGSSAPSGNVAATPGCGEASGYYCACPGGFPQCLDGAWGCYCPPWGNGAPTSPIGATGKGNGNGDAGSASNDGSADGDGPTLEATVDAPEGGSDATVE